MMIAVIFTFSYHKSEVTSLYIHKVHNLDETENLNSPIPIFKNLICSLKPSQKENSKPRWFR